MKQNNRYKNVFSKCDCFVYIIRHIEYVYKIICKQRLARRL